MPAPIRFPVSELIDTLWNVNDEKHEIITIYPRINRYIMECKCINFCNNLIDVDELIDTLWNVNALAQHFEESENSELIDTLWNVNF